MLIGIRRNENNEVTAAANVDINIVVGDVLVIDMVSQL